MYKKYLLLLGVIFLFATRYVVASDVAATDFMLMNGYDARQSDNLWQRIRAGFKLDHTETPRVKYYERMYSRNPKALARMLNNAKPYLYFLLTEVERRGMPTELVFIPGIESRYNPLVTRKDDPYAGMWQFIPMTGRRFNMQQNSTIDERRDVVKSSTAALDYLDYLHSIFLQWDVSIGAYNWGEGGMYRAIVGSGQTIGHVTYSKLKVRKITLDYEPKMIALANIIANPSKFGVKLIDAPNQPYFAIVHPEDMITLSHMEAVSQVNKKMFHKLNGQYKSKSFQLQPRNRVLLPLANQTIYYASIGKTNNINQLPASPINNSTVLASNNNVNADEYPDERIDPRILLTNGDGSPTSYSGETKAEAKISAAKLANIDAIADAAMKYEQQHQNQHHVTANQKVDSIDMAANVEQGSNQQVNTNSNSYQKQVANNHVSHYQPHSDNMNVNDLIDQIASSSTDKVTHYTVTTGDTLYSIAKHFNMTVASLKAKNNLNGSAIKVGQTLLVRTN